MYNVVQMSQVGSVHTEKTCLSHMYDTSLCDQHNVEQLDIHKVSSFDSCCSALKFYLIKIENAS